MTDAVSCPQCGQQVGGGDLFCPHCGAGLPDAAGDGAPAEENPWQAVLTQLVTVTQGRFAIERELGQGGMAAVYLAQDLALNRKVAIKLLSPAMLMERGMVSRFKQEAVTIAALRHPSIVTVHAVEHHDQLHFFVLEFVEGGSLEQVLATFGPLPIPAVRAWLAQMAGALEYAHRRGVVHRDIKPGNVLLDKDGNAIVTDFGIAKVAEKRGLTQTGTTMGTPTYMSPEQCFARPVGPPSDQYSLGIMVYEMLTGRPPFEGSALEVMRAHTDFVPPSLAEVRPDCPPELARVVARMLEKDPAARWPNLVEAMAAGGAQPPALDDPVWQQLAGLVRGDADIQTLGSLATPTTPLPVTPVRAPRRRRRAGLVGAGVVAAAVVVGAVALTQWPRGVEAPAPATVAVALDVGPIPGVLAVGAAARLTATLRDSLGAGLATPAATWMSSDTAVAAVTEGLIEARQPGRATITARSGGLAASVVVEVKAAADTSTPAVRPVVTRPAPSPPPTTPERAAAPETAGAVTVAPVRIELDVGRSAALTASVTGTRGTRLPDRAVTWRSTNPDVATVSADGRVSARGPGVAVVTASADGVTAQAAVTVRAPAPTLTDGEAGRQIRGWIEGFATRLDAAIRARDLAAVRGAYEAPMPAADVAEWQRRLGLDAGWQARFARTYPPRRVGTTWVSDFEITIVVEAGGRRRETDQRFFAVFEPAPGGGIAVSSVELRLAE